jgi:hypothetical protein
LAANPGLIYHGKNPDFTRMQYGSKGSRRKTSPIGL